MNKTTITSLRLMMTTITEYMSSLSDINDKKRLNLLQNHWQNLEQAIYSIEALCEIIPNEYKNTLHTDDSVI